MNIRKITYTAFFIALGIVVPQVFHLIGGPATGMTLLPMHIPVLLGAIVLGPISGLIIGISSVFVGSMLGMPTMPMAFFMFFELSVYGLVAGYLGYIRKINVYITLICSMLAGRIVSWSLMSFVIGVMGMKLPPIFGTIAIYVTGIPGVVIQIFIIPALVYVLRRYIKYE